MLLLTHIVLILAFVSLFISLLAFIQLQVIMLQQTFDIKIVNERLHSKNKLDMFSNLSFAIGIILLVVTLVIYHGGVV